MSHDGPAPPRADAQCRRRTEGRVSGPAAGPKPRPNCSEVPGFAHQIQKTTTDYTDPTDHTETNLSEGSHFNRRAVDFS